MRTFKNLVLPYLLLVLSTVGCVAGLQRLPNDAATATSGMVVSISTPKAVYTVKESIKLDISIQNGQFDLLVPFADIATSGAFTQLTVKDSDGNLIKPERSISTPRSEEIFIEKNGKSIQCIEGFALKAAATQTLSLEDLRKYYRLQKGSYTIAVTMELSIYRHFLKKRHPEIIELEAEIQRIQKVSDAHVSAADKRSAVNDLQRQIEFLKKKHTDIYLPIKSLLGKTSLTSNSIRLTIMTDV